MIPFDEALRTVLGHTARLDPTPAPLPHALGMVLAEDVAADVDMPPFNKSAMDGFAVVAADLAELPCSLPVVRNIPAGALPSGPLAPGQCARIMTGAPVPDGADTVVRVELTEQGPGEHEVTFRKAEKKGSNICWRAEDVAAGDVVLRAGHCIRAPETALLAACGRDQITVFRKPSVAILSTGDEVVPISQVPEPGQIRDANSHYLSARLHKLGVPVTLLGIARDEEGDLRQAIGEGLEHDVLVLSGGVSMGDYDLVPGVLKDAGAAILFDSVAMKPGRPTVYARCGECAIFGLPGNPVSVLVSCEVLVLPAIRKMMGHAETEAPRRRARLTEAASHKPKRRSHLPGRLAETAKGWTVQPLPYHGSAHIEALGRANALIVLPAGVPRIEAGADAEVIEFHG